MQLLFYIQSYTNLPEGSIQNTIKLLNEDCTVPFISRYRKEATGNLDEVQIGEIVKFKEQFEALSKRKESILKSLSEQNELTQELQTKIEQSKNLTELEDLYLPYKKKRKTKAEKARANGLEPLAKLIMSTNTHDIQNTVKRFLNKEVKTTEEAFEGAKHIISEWVNERIDVRNYLRNQLEKFSTITTKVNKKKETEESALKFKDYFDWSESLNRIPSHRLLAILRAENEGFIKFNIETDKERALDYINSRVIKTKNRVCANLIEDATRDAYKRLLYPSLSNEAIQNAKEIADKKAINVFAKNLKQLLLGAPLGESNVLGIDPGFRTGCKLVCLDKNGNLKHNETIYPHPPQNKSSEAIDLIIELCKKFNIEAIAIGNGTASRETEALVKQIQFNIDIKVFVVSEAGASIYSASKIAREEFPNHDVTVRGAISIGRRLQDPLSELVKTDPKSIGVGQYQHDVDQKNLKKELDAVVEHCVNAVGVNINTASKSLLSYVSGLGEKLAENIVNHRSENGAFKSRKEILKVARLGNKAYEQAAAFLKIKEAKNPLDNSAVHPESYAIVKQMAKDLGVTEMSLVGNKNLLSKIKLENYCNNTVGLVTLKDIVKELEKPGLDVRESAKEFSFDENIKNLTDVIVGMELPGIVNNITNFGAFVDIGIKESGLIHVSNISETYVSDINEHISLHEKVKVKVIEVDVNRKRIQLKLLKN